MGENQKDLLWQAYIDGEMTACEAAEFEQSLNPQELDRLTGEMRFESALSDNLTAKMSCPQSAWSRIQKELSDAGMDIPKTIPFYRTPAFYGSIGALAAAVVLMFTVMNKPLNSAELTVPVDIPLNLTAGTENELNSFFTDNGINIHVAEPPDAYHNIELKGMRYASFAGEDIVELYYTCCGKPVDIMLVKKGSKAEEALASDVNKSRIQAIKDVGDYRAALLSIHPSSDVLALVASR